MIDGLAAGTQFGSQFKILKITSNTTDLIV